MEVTFPLSWLEFGQALDSYINMQLKEPKSNEDKEKEFDKSIRESQMAMQEEEKQKLAEQQKGETQPTSEINFCIDEFLIQLQMVRRQ